MSAPYIPALYGGEASDWLRPRPWQPEGDNLVAGGHQSGNGYSTGISHTQAPYLQPPSSRRGASHVGSQDEEAVSVTHDTLPQVVKASALYYKKIKTYVQVITGNLTSAAALRADKSTEQHLPPLIITTQLAELT